MRMEDGYIRKGGARWMGEMYECIIDAREEEKI